MIRSVNEQGLLNNGSVLAGEESSHPNQELLRTSDACLRFPSCMQAKEVSLSRCSLEFVVHHFYSTDGKEVAALSSLSAQVFSRVGSPLGRYELRPDISGPVGVELARLLMPLSDAQGDETHVAKSLSKKEEELLLKTIEGKLKAAGGFEWRAYPLLRNPQNSLMKRVLPSFAEFVAHPDLALDRVWRSERVLGDRLQIVEATILPKKHRVVFDARTIAVRYEDGEFDRDSIPVAQESFSASAPPRSTTAGRSPSEEEQLKRLEELTLDAMCTFNTAGLDAMRNSLSGGSTQETREQPDEDLADDIVESSFDDDFDSFVEQDVEEDADSRLLHRDRNAGEQLECEILPSGAELQLNVGENIALLSLRANGSDLSSWVGWAVVDRQGIQRAGSGTLQALREACELIKSGDADSCRSALGLLDRVCDRSGGRFFTNGCSLDEVLSFELQTDLDALAKIDFEQIAPVSHEQILELINGVQLVQVKLSNPSFNSQAPTHFDRLLFGIYPDNSLFVQTMNPLGGQLKGRISASTCRDSGGYREVIRSIAEELNHSSSPPTTRPAMYSALERLVLKDPDSNTLSSPFDSFGARIPPVHRLSANKAYEEAGLVARLWAHVGGGIVNDVRVEWVENTDMCRATIGDLDPNASSMQLIVDHEGVSRILINVAYGETNVKTKRLAVEPRSGDTQDLRKDKTLSKIFRLHLELLESQPATAEAVEQSALFRFLKKR